MPNLSDGTPIQIQEETYNEILAAFADAFDENDQEVLVEIKGYKSKSTGGIIDVTLNVVFNYKELIIEAWEHVVDYSLGNVNTSIASKDQWEAAKEELRESFWGSMQDNNARDYTSRSAESVSESVPSVRVGYSSGLLQIQGVVVSYRLIEEGEKKKRKSRPKTLAKKEILEGTFRDSDTKGALKTLALEKGRFESITIGAKTFSSDGFYSDVQDDAIRVFTGDRGHSKRIVLSKKGDKAVIELQKTSGLYQIEKRYTNPGASKKVSRIRSDLGIASSAVAYAEISRSKTLRSATMVATVIESGLTVKEIKATSKKSAKVGPSPSSETFVEVKRENKKIKKGETLLFIKPVSQQISVNLDWDKKQDLDLGCFVELANGGKWLLQPLGGRFGAIDYAPYVLHSGDDRHGNSEDGEYMHSEISNLKHIRRIVFYAMIYSGASNWMETDAVATIGIPGRATIEIPLNEQSSADGQGRCVLCTLTPNVDTLSVQRHITFHRDGLIKKDGRNTTEMDLAYDFGLSWITASKD